MLRPELQDMEMFADGMDKLLSPLKSKERRQNVFHRRQRRPGVPAVEDAAASNVER